jgi:hypothetical protein
MRNLGATSLATTQTRQENAVALLEERRARMTEIRQEIARTDAEEQKSGGT